MAICALILVLAFVIFLLWQLFSTQIPKLWLEKNQQNEQIIKTEKDDVAIENNKDTSNTTSINGSGKTGTEITTSTGPNGVATTTSSEKEEKLREILKQKTTQDPATDAKTTRPNVQNKKMAEKLFNPIQPLESLRLQKIIQKPLLYQRTVIIENMVVGPEVRTLTVFNSKKIKLSNGLDVKLLQGIDTPITVQLKIGARVIAM